MDTTPAREVAKELKTSPMKIKSGILNGTLPIGTVLHDPHSKKDRIIIVTARWEAWRNGQDLEILQRSK